VTTGFRRTRDGGAKARFSAEEAAVVRSLMTQLVDLLDDPDSDEPIPGLALSGNTSVSDDPVLARLFPDAYGDDDAAAAEFRRYTEASLRETKRGAADSVIETLKDGTDGTEVTLNAETAQAWLRALNDIRLALGTRLGITEDSDLRVMGMDADDPRTAALAAYDWLTHLQETLVHALW
jgi:hypothetical protein